MKMVGHIEDIKGNPSILLSLLDQTKPSKNLSTNDMFEGPSIILCVHARSTLSHRAKHATDYNATHQSLSKFESCKMQN